MKLNDVLDTLTMATLYIKDNLNIILFLEMSNIQWLTAFNASPVSLVIQPILATSMLVLSAIQLHQLYKEKNRTIDSWLNTVGGTVASILFNIAIYGGILTLWAGVSFAAGPWIFLAATSLGLIHQAIMLGLHAHRAVQAPQDSVLRKHHLQAMTHHALMLVLCVTTVIALTFIMLTPAAPMVGTVFALLAVSMIAASLIWRHLPHENKLKIKAFFGMGKPEQNNSLDNNLKAEQSLLRDTRLKALPLVDTGASQDSKQKGGLRFFKNGSGSEKNDYLSAQNSGLPSKGR